MAHNKDKHPETWAKMESAKTALEPLMAKRKEYTEQIKVLRRAQMEAFREAQREIEAVNAMAMTDIDQIRKLRKTIARCANEMK